MITPEQNELLCRVEGDAPMGQLMRSHWIPALLSEQLDEPDGRPPVADLELAADELPDQVSIVEEFQEKFPMPIGGRGSGLRPFSGPMPHEPGAAWYISRSNSNLQRRCALSQRGGSGPAPILNCRGRA